MLLIDRVRKETGLRMAGLHIGKHVGWTTDREKAERAHALGCNIQHYRSPWSDHEGWEVTLHEGTEA